MSEDEAYNFLKDSVKLDFIKKYFLEMNTNDEAI
jgi:hypothetical protein